MTVLARCWKPSEIVKIELTRVILCFLPSCLDLNATRNHTPSAQLNQPRLLQKARRYRHRLRLAFQQCTGLTTPTKPVGVMVAPPSSNDSGAVTGAEPRSAGPAGCCVVDEARTGAGVPAPAECIPCRRFRCASRRLRSSSICSCCSRTWALRSSISSCRVVAAAGSYCDGRRRRAEARPMRVP